MKNLLKAREKFGLTEFYCEDINYGYIYKNVVLKIIEGYEIINYSEYRYDGCKEYSFLTSLPWKRYNKKDNFFGKIKKFISKFIIGESEKVKFWLEFYYHKKDFLNSSEGKDLKDNKNENYLYLGVNEFWISALWDEMSWGEKFYIKFKTLMYR